MTLINLAAVAVCAVMYWVLGALWYSPLLFAKPWSAMMGMAKDHMKDPKVKKRAMRGYAASIVCAFAMAYMLAGFTRFIYAGDFVTGALIGFWCWLGFTATTVLPNHVFSTHKKPIQLFAINAGYPLLGLMMMGGVLAVWK